MICDKTGKECPYCSDEIKRTYSRATVIKTGQIERKETVIPLGQFCNNDGKHYVRDLEQCPIPEAGSVPLIPRDENPLLWMKLRGGA